ncbi:MAG: division/cell wall cluster transcriptional repressor MraZ [Angelakisella sp.]
MLIGQYEHSLDSKGRMNFPAKFREDLGERFIATKGLDACVAVYSFGEWQLLADKVKRLPEAKSALLKRFFFAGAVEVEPDKQGRIVLPAHLRGYASLDKDVVVAGVLDKVEIWDSQRWTGHTGEMTAEAMSAAISAMEDF